MQSKAKTVDQYIASLPADRRAAIQTVRDVILKNLDKDYEEGMQYGMIGYYVPHSIFPEGYHCDPKQPLPYAGLASQKGHMSLYMGCVYGDEEYTRKFQAAWKATGKKLDMGKVCIRFKDVEDLALDVIGDTIRSLPARKYIAGYVLAREKHAASGSKKPASKPKAATKKPAAGQHTAKPRKRAAAAKR